MTGYNPAPLRAEQARENADASDWHQTDAAKALIASYLRIDGLYQIVAREVSAAVDEAFYQELLSLECELDNVRSKRIYNEIGNLSERDQENDYLCEAIEESAPSVTTVLDAARKAMRDAERMAA